LRKNVHVQAALVIRGLSIRGSENRSKPRIARKFNGIFA